MRSVTKRLIAAAGGLALAGAGFGSAVPAQASDTAAIPQQVSVPAYIYPNQETEWGQLNDGAPTVGIAIANPASGPGTSFDQNYADAIQAADDAGVRVIGYVRTGYFGTTGIPTNDGQTSFEAWTRQIEAEVDTWYDLYGSYGLDGIFFDEALADCGPDDVHVNLYVEIAEHVRQQVGAATVVDNPGTSVERCYLRAADTLVTFEGEYSTYQSWEPPAWQASAYPDQLWHLVHNTPASNLADAMALSKDRNAGHVYVTPDVLPNPWDTLPPDPYWAEELELAASTSE